MATLKKHNMFFGPSGQMKAVFELEAVLEIEEREAGRSDKWRH